MRVMICGIDGYLGWSLALYLTEAGHDVCGLDNCTRRLLVTSCGGDSAFPIPNVMKRKALFEKVFEKELRLKLMDLRDHVELTKFMAEMEPDAVVHLAEMPSAPFSMIGPKACIDSYVANVAGHLALLWALRDMPWVHLVKLGTMGEYGTPKIPIAEGKFPVTYKGKTDLLHPGRSPISFYHASKCADTVNTELACKIWNLRATDVMQGIVYGSGLDVMVDEPQLQTRFDFDAVFGTVVNRFCAQAVLNRPMLLYGGGKQTRALLPLQDSMQCLRLLLEHPARPGEYRVVNQYDRSYCIEELAQEVALAAAELGLTAAQEAIANPRVEEQEHFFQPECGILKDLGYMPSGDIHRTLTYAIDALMPFRDRLKQLEPSLYPCVNWRRHAK